MSQLRLTQEQFAAHNKRIRGEIAGVVAGLKAPVKPLKSRTTLSGKGRGIAGRAQLSLPWPPSVNHYWRRNKGLGMHISDEGKAYRARVQALCRVVGGVPGRIAVQIIAYPPDKRFRDLDNIFKALLDGLVYGMVISDDGLIDDLHITRREVVKGGRVDVVVTNFP